MLTTLLLPALAAAPSGPAVEGVAVQVQVRDIPGDPLAAVHIFLEGPGEVLRAETSSRGIAAFPSVPSGRYRLRAEKDGYRTHIQTLDLAGGAPRMIQFRLVRILPAAP